MAEANQQKMDIEFKGMPGADAASAEEVQPFQVDLNFDAPVPPEEEVTFPAEQEVIEETAEAAVVEEAPDESVSEDTSEAAVSEEVEAEAAVADTEAETETETETAVAETETDTTAETEVEAVDADAVQETADVAEEEVAEVQEPEPPKAPMVPKSRLDEVLAKNKKMQKQIDEIQQKEAEAAAEAPVYDFDTKEQQYQQLVLDGATEEATKLRNEIRSAEKEQLMFEMKQQMGQTVQQDRATQELQNKAAEIANTIDIFNEESASFNEELTKEVAELRDAFIIQGYEPADSLARATEYTLAAKHPELLRGEAEVATVKTQQNKDIAKKRQTTTVQKKLAASKSQPPTMKGEGTSKRGVTATNVNTLSDDEFSALPEETLRRLRGDFG